MLGNETFDDGMGWDETRSEPPVRSSELLDANVNKNKTIRAKMTHIIYGDGKIKTNIGMVEDRRCLTMKDTGKPRVVGTTSLEGQSTDPQENFDVIISFRTIEGARLLQDMLSELVCKWSREISPKVESI